MRWLNEQYEEAPIPWGAVFNEWFGSVLFFGGAASIGYGVYHWLRFGEWFTVSITTLWDWVGWPPEDLIFNFQWTGINEIFTFLFTVHIAWLLIVSGALWGAYTSTN